METSFWHWGSGSGLAVRQIWVPVAALQNDFYFIFCFLKKNRAGKIP